MVSDTDSSGEFANYIPLTAGLENALPDMATGASIRAIARASGSSINTNTVDILFRYSTTTANEYALAHARYDNGTVGLAQRLSSNIFDDYSGLEPRGLFSFDDATMYGFTQAYEFAFDIANVPAATSGQLLADRFILAAAQGADSANFLSFELGPPVSLWSQKVMASDIAAVDLSLATKIGEYATIGDIPVNEGAIGWWGDIGGFIGYPVLSPSVMRYFFVDPDGNERGQKDLPFTATIDAAVTREEIERVGADLADLDFDTDGGALHIVWRDRQRRDQQTDSFDVLYYDTLDCTPVVPAP